MRRTVDLVFIGKRENMVPFLRIVVYFSTALPCKGENALPVAANPDIRDLFLQIGHLFVQLSLRFLSDPSEDTVPGIQL